MDFTKIFLQNISKDYIYEDEYMKVTKVLREIKSTSKNYVKRVQLVIWKKKKTDIPDLDIRSFSSLDKKYGKGITLTMSEAEELYNSLKELISK
jgi:hypothetical protein